MRGHNMMLLLPLYVLLAFLNILEFGAGPAGTAPHGTALVVREPGATVIIDDSVRTALAAGPVRVDSPHVTIVLDVGTVIDGTGLDHPFVVATADARGLRVVSSQPGRAARLVGFAGGVHASATAACEVRDIDVRASAGDGVVLGPGARVSGVSVESSLGIGLRAGARSVVDSSRALGNAGVGVHLGDGSQVRNVTSANNGADGFLLGRGCIARSMTAVANAGSGIAASYSALIEASVAESNSVDGVRVDDGSTVYATVANDNGDSGVRTGFGSTVIGGSARSNVRVGCDLGSGTLLSEAVASNGFVGVLAHGDARVGSALVVGNAHGIVTFGSSPADVLSAGCVVRSSSDSDVAEWTQDDVMLRLARD